MNTLLDIMLQNINVHLCVEILSLLLLNGPKHKYHFVTSVLWNFVLKHFICLEFCSRQKKNEYEKNDNNMKKTKLHETYAWVIYGSWTLQSPECEKLQMTISLKICSRDLYFVSTEFSPKWWLSFYLFFCSLVGVFYWVWRLLFGKLSD